MFPSEPRGPYHKYHHYQEKCRRLEESLMECFETEKARGITIVLMRYISET
jgi:hypothetical protein